jgi:hypothetical protein
LAKGKAKVGYNPQGREHERELSPRVGSEFAHAPCGMWCMGCGACVALGACASCVPCRVRLVRSGSVVCVRGVYPLPWWGCGGVGG